jgi:DNA-binding transcriptional MocR family regulator
MDLSWHPILNKEEKPLFLTLVRALAEDIGTGKLPNGFRLPPQRELADQLKVALGTVTRAYDEAEKRGLVFGDGRRGTFVGEAPRPKHRFASLARTTSAGIDLSRNHPVPDFDPNLGETLRQIAKSSGVQEHLFYPPPAGLMAHRYAGARWIGEIGLNVNPENIFICGGAQHGLLAIFAAAARRQDIVAVEEYSYPGMKAVAEMLGLELMGIAMDEEGIIPEALESVCRQKDVRMLYCNPSFQNPTNAMMSSERRYKIADIAEKYDIMVVEDEILSPFLEKRVEFLTGIIPERSYYLLSPSKAVTSGLRTGYIVAPPKVRQKLADAMQGISLGVPSLTAEVFRCWLEDGTVRKIIRRRKEELTARQKITLEILGNFRVKTRGASHHAWLELPEEWSGQKFAEETLSRGVAVAPAEIFAVEGKAATNAVRISVGSAPNREVLRTGLEIIADILSGFRRHKAATV